MKKLWRIILSSSLVILIALLTFNATMDLTTSYSIQEQTQQDEAKEITNPETEQKMQEEIKEEKEQHESNNKVLFYTGIILLIILVGAMLLVFLSKAEE